ncbi:MAG: prenyltransferase/squalene oxidase repeat-containing protein [Promethearchaeota archaeon]
MMKKRLIFLVVVLFLVIMPVFSMLNPSKFQKNTFLYDNNSKDMRKSSFNDNNDILSDVLTSRIQEFEENGYFKQNYRPSLQSIYHAIFILDSVGKLNAINESSLISFILSFYDNYTNSFIDDYAKRFLDTDFSLYYYPLNTLLETTCYAVLTLNLLNALDKINIQGIVDFIWNCYNPDTSGFIGRPYSINLDDGFKVATLDNTYFAVITLNMLMTDWSGYSDEKNALIQFINSLQMSGDLGGFRNDLDPYLNSLGKYLNEPNIIASYYAIKVLEIFGMIETIDILRFHSFLGSLYNADKYYFDVSPYLTAENQTNIIATSMGLELARLTNFNNINESKILNFIYKNRINNGGWYESTSTKRHEIIDTFQVIRSLKNLNYMDIFNPIEKEEIKGYTKYFKQVKGYSGFSEEFASLSTIYSSVYSSKLQDKVSQLKIQQIYNQLISTFTIIKSISIESPGFYAYINPDSSDYRTRTYPIEYNSIAKHELIDDVGMKISHKSMYHALKSMQILYKLDDFSNEYNLTLLLNSIINSQFLGYPNNEKFGAFLPYESLKEFSEKIQESKIFFGNSYYAIKTLELIASTLNLGDIVDLNFDKNALAAYITRNVVETPNELYIKPYHTSNIDKILESTYQACYILKSIDKFNLNTGKILNFVKSNLNYTKFNGIYYSFKICELLNLIIDFDLKKSQKLVKNLYSERLHDFFYSTKKNSLDKTSISKISEIAKIDSIRITAKFDEPVLLGNTFLLSVNTCNLVLENLGPYGTIKFYSKSVGAISLEFFNNNTYQGRIFVPFTSENYPDLSGNILLYDGALLIANHSVLIPTEYQTFIKTKIEHQLNSVEISIIGSYISQSGSEPMYNANVLAVITLNNNSFETLKFIHEDKLDHSLFSLSFKPELQGNYTLKIYLDDGISSDFNLIATTDLMIKLSNTKPGKPIIKNNASNGIILSIILMIFPLTLIIGGKKYINHRKNEIKSIE